MHSPSIPPPPPRCSFSRCSSSVSKAPLLSPSCQTISSVVSKVSCCCLNSYRSAIITAFSFSPLMCGCNWGWWWRKRGYRVREYPAIWQRKRTHTKAWDKSKWFLKTLPWVSRDAALIFIVFFSRFVCRGPEYFSSLMAASAVTLPWTLLPHTIVSLTRERKANSYLLLARQTEALLVNEPETLGSVYGCSSSAGSSCNSSPSAACLRVLRSLFRKVPPPQSAIQIV